MRFINIKKLVSVMLALAVLFAVVSCRDKNSNSEKIPPSNSTEMHSSDTQTDTETTDVSSTETSSIAKDSNSTSSSQSASTSDAGFTTSTMQADPTAQADSTMQADSTAQTNSANQADDANQTRQYIEDLVLTGTDGTTVKLSSLAKENTLLVFWATWCGYCIKEIPILQELAEEYDNLSIVMINAGDTKDTVASFQKENNMTLKSFCDEDLLITQEYGITGFPSIIFLSEDLEIISFVSGKMNKEHFEDAFKKIKEFRTERGDFN